MLGTGATIAELAQNYRQGGRAEAVKVQLARIADPAGEGVRTFFSTFDEQALAQAQAYDRASNPPALAGITVSIKDLFDIAGQATAAGSTFLRKAPPAKRDALVVQRLRKAGLIPIGRTNMTEFAYSGLGINPHFGTPANPFDRAAKRIPGGSSSGAAVSVADGMADVGLGTDTGGSCRIPAALCGLVGFKPTASRVPRDGVLPLSPTLDSVGPLARSVACCAAVDSVLADDPTPIAEVSVAQLRLGVPSAYVFDDVDATTAKAFEAALSRLSKAGAKIETVDASALLDIPKINHKGGFSAREAYLYHRAWIAEHGAEYDPRVVSRIVKGESQTDEDERILVRERQRLIASVAHFDAFDALVMPTTPLVAPTIAELADEAAYTRVNLLMLRNCTVTNTLDRCAISLPCHTPGSAPVGLMLMGAQGADRRLLGVAQAVESALG
ncbi:MULTISPECIES: amidase [unclassified Beijerinckia]|uniref:amidase n=1 Tax=unclassified Beijerinckia TaxID=2638183 RepID=UPI00089A0B19|nr:MULTISPECIES: amidase [unclassified Beijerinckia]MDH7794002.1 aspartyl-tRNA(Asn)/glutamyl-tRNA(Gln) amidotransferase subunit A [Beijerinckia sp. GAS462]SEB51199.1 aspartyl-tRNA(Asn)/glutamyl-tRNA(Gln) amidotransferase subunit A [Beijerinckia sp. 28-YEA-48]